MAGERIAENVRAYAETLALGEVHIEIAVTSALRFNSAEHGRIVAERIARKLDSLRQRFNIKTNYRENVSFVTQS